MDYDFWDKLKEGKEKEIILDEYFSKWYSVSTVPPEFERYANLDRIYEDNSGRKFTVEYKSDKWTASTGNFFVETKSVKEENVLGWSYTTLSQLVLYFVPQKNMVYVVDVVKMKNLMILWMKDCEEQEVKNEKSGYKYTTIGILVPENKFMECVEAVVRIR